MSCRFPGPMISSSQFHRTHEQRYGYADSRRQVEVVNARVRMIMHTEPAAFARREVTVRRRSGRHR